VAEPSAEGYVVFRISPEAFAEGSEQ
jgi:hypothetical protein